MERYDTLSEIIPMMQTNAQSNGFSVSKNCLSCASFILVVAIEAFQIDKMFRFNGINNSDGNGISLKMTATKGFLEYLMAAYSGHTLRLFAEMEPKFKSN